MKKLRDQNNQSGKSYDFSRKRLFLQWAILFAVIGFIGFEVNAKSPTNSKVLFWRGQVDNANATNLKNCGFNCAYLPLEDTYKDKANAFQAQGIKVWGFLPDSQWLGRLGNGDITNAINDPSQSTELNSFLNAFLSFNNYTSPITLEGIMYDVEFGAFDISSNDIESFKYYTKRTGSLVPDQIIFNNPVMSPDKMIRWEQDEESVGNSFSYANEWQTSYHDYFSAGTAIFCNDSGTATIKFTGSVIGAIISKSAYGGIVNVQIDGVNYPSIDSYSASDVHQAFVPIASNLTSGQHTLTLTNLENKNGLSLGHFFVLDAITTASDGANGSVSFAETGSNNRLIQTFKASHAQMNGFAFKMRRTTGVSMPNMIIDVNVFAVDANGQPTGNPINTYPGKIVDCTEVKDYYKLFKVYLPTTLIVGNTYAVVLWANGPYYSTNYYEVASAGKNYYADGQALHGQYAPFSAFSPADDLQFFIYCPQDSSTLKLRDDWVNFRCWQVAQCAELYRGKLKEAANIGKTTVVDCLSENNWLNWGYLGYNSTYDKSAQTFKATDTYFAGIAVGLKKDGNERPLKGVEITLQNTNYVNGYYEPNGEILASSSLPEVGISPAFYPYYRKTFVPLECSLVSGKTYAVVFDYDDQGDSANYSSSNYYSFANCSSSYNDGTYLKGNSGGSWTNYPNGDMGFELQYLDFSNSTEIVGENNLNGDSLDSWAPCGSDIYHDKYVQIFQPTYKYLSSANVYIKKIGTPTQNMNISIQKASYNTSLHAWIPDGINLAADSISQAEVGTSFTNVTLNLNCELDLRNKYALVLDYDEQGNTSNYSTVNNYRIGTKPTGMYYNLGNMVRGHYDDSWYAYNNYDQDIGFRCNYIYFPQLQIYSSAQEMFSYNSTIMERYSADWRYLGDHSDIPIAFGPGIMNTTETRELVAPRTLLGTDIWFDTVAEIRKNLLHLIIDINGAGFSYFNWTDARELTAPMASAWVEVTTIIKNFEDLFINAQNYYYSTSALISSNISGLNNDYSLLVLEHDKERLVFVFSNTTATNVVLNNYLLPNETLRFLRYDNGAWTKDSNVLTGPTATISITDILPDEIHIFYISTESNVDDKLNEINQP